MDLGPRLDVDEGSGSLSMAQSTGLSEETQSGFYTIFQYVSPI